MYGIDMFMIVTQEYDLDGDGTYETPYDYQEFRRHFNKVATVI